MKLRSLLLFVAVLLMVGLTARFLDRARNFQRLGKPGVKLVDQPVYDAKGQVLSTNSIFLPELSGYTSETRPIDDAVLTWLPKDTTYGQRFYKATDGFQAQLSVVLMGADRTSIHKPQYCLPAQNWKIESTEETAIPIAQPHDYALPIMKIIALKEAQLPNGERFVRRSLYLYWFVTDNKVTAGHNDWMWSLIKHLLWTGELQRWAYVSCFTTCAPGEEQAAYQRMTEVIAAAVPQFQLAAGQPLKLARKP